MATDTAISKLVLSFFFHPLIWTNLIKFRYKLQLRGHVGDNMPNLKNNYRCVFVCAHLSEEELDSSHKGEQLAELDSLETEKALLLTEDDHMFVPSPGYQAPWSYV